MFNKSAALGKVVEWWKATAAWFKWLMQGPVLLWQHSPCRCDTSQKTKIVPDVTICGSVIVWEHSCKKKLSATKCDSPAKNQNTSRHVLIFVVALASMMWCPITTSVTQFHHGTFLLDILVLLLGQLMLDFSGSDLYYWLEN